MIHLYTSYYIDPEENRARELLTCLERNATVGFGAVHLLGGRPTFRQFFELINKNATDDSVSVLANSDIYFDPLGLEQFQEIRSGEIWCLSRHEAQTGTVEVDPRVSQDCWVFRGPIVVPLACDFPLGVLGCDNRIALELRRTRMRVLNPCLSVRVWHLHASGVRRQGEVINPPYWFVDPVTLEGRDQ